MWATIIIAESFTRIMGSAACNVYSTIVAVVSCSITLWILVGGGQNFLRPLGGGWPPCPPLAPALSLYIVDRLMVVVEGECRTPCKKRGEIVQGGLSRGEYIWGICPEENCPMAILCPWYLSSQFRAIWLFGLLAQQNVCIRFGDSRFMLTAQLIEAINYRRNSVRCFRTCGGLHAVSHHSCRAGRPPQGR